MSSELARPRIGGQAVMEGVMMNGTKHYSVAVRKQNGEITSELFDSSSLTDKGGFFNWFIVRGVIRFAESLIIGMKTLDYSASFFVEEENKKEAKTAFGRWWQKNGDNIITTITMFVAILLALGMFVFLPTFCARWIHANLMHEKMPYLLGVMEGVLRMIFFLLYLILVSQIKDIRRTFQYHGAEHKTINTFEDEAELTVENVKKRSRFNKRCGTSFLFIIMIISILVNSLIQITQPLPRTLVHIALIPVIAGLSYELLKLSARSDNWLINALVRPGLWIQRITTNEPDDEEIEVAIESVRKLLETEHPEFLS